MRVHLKGDFGVEDFSNLFLQMENGDIHEDDEKVNIPNNLCVVVRDLKSLSEKMCLNVNTFHLENLHRLKKELFLHQRMMLQ